MKTSQTDVLIVADAPCGATSRTLRGSAAVRSTTSVRATEIQYRPEFDGVDSAGGPRGCITDPEQPLADHLPHGVWIAVEKISGTLDRDFGWKLDAWRYETP